MSAIRAQLTEKSKYFVDKHRYYELKHFCLQYPTWKKAYNALDDSSIPLSMIERVPTSNMPSDPTTKRAMMKVLYAEKIHLIEKNSKRS